MEIRFNVTGAARKAFVTVVGDLVGWEPVYRKAPTFAYAVNNLTIDKEGALIFPENMAMDEAAQLLDALAEHGYPSVDLLPTTVSLGEDITEETAPPEGTPEHMPMVEPPSEAVADVGAQEDADLLPTTGFLGEDIIEETAPPEETLEHMPMVEPPSEAVADMDAQEDAPVTAFPEQAQDSPDTLSIELPWEGFTEQSYNNLVRLVESKAGLICQSIGAEELVIQHDEERICFPWFAPDSTPEAVKVYTQLVSALCKMAKEQQRITATSREVENPKYAMRCFLLRLGFIGDEYAAARKLLLRNLSGNSSFKSGARKERPADHAPNPADSAPVTEGVNTAGDLTTALETALTGGDSDLAEMLADAMLIHEMNASFEALAHE